MIMQKSLVQIRDFCFVLEGVTIKTKCEGMK